jgi:hypothetical protein
MESVSPTGDGIVGSPKRREWALQANTLIRQENMDLALRLLDNSSN